jgi:hypothetical protein
VFALLVLLQSSAPPVTVEGQGSPTAEIPRLEAAVRIDGVLDEPVWPEAARLTGFWQYQPVDGRPAEERTEVLVWYAPDVYGPAKRAIAALSRGVGSEEAVADQATKQP